MASIDDRTDYTKGSLNESDLDSDPLRQFLAWLEHAQSQGVPEPNAMVVATVDDQARPSARVVLLREVDDRSFIFYTNYDSRKGRELAANAVASLVFFWPALERQVRVEGRVEQVDDARSDQYFASRPRLSQLAAWASTQSTVVARRADLEQSMDATRTRFGDGPVPRPPHWGGYRVVPYSLEFWQGRRSRLHDRLVYRRDANGPWTIERLAP